MAGREGTQFPAADDGRPTLGPAIILSPHYDDGVLSCGGLAANLAAAGYPPLMVTVFGGEVPEDLVGDFARWKHGRWGYESADAVLDGATQRRLGGSHDPRLPHTLARLLRRDLSRRALQR